MLLVYVHAEITEVIQQGLTQYSIKPDLEQAFFQVLQAILPKDSQLDWRGCAAPLERLLGEQHGDDLSDSILMLLKIDQILEHYIQAGDDKVLRMERWRIFHCFQHVLKGFLIKIMLCTPHFRSVEVQIKILPAFAKYLFEMSLGGSGPHYPDAFLSVWTKVLFDLQSSAEASEHLKDLIVTHFVREFRWSKYFFTNLGYQEVYQRRLDVLSLPIRAYAADHFPLELMSSTVLAICYRNKMPTDVSEVPAVWAYQIWQSLQQMNPSSRAIWLNILQHTGQMTLAVEATWLEQANALVAQLPTAEFNQTLQQWLKWIAAEVPRKTAPLSNHNKPFVLGLLGFASLGQAKTMEKILLKYHKFFQMKCHHLNKRSAAVVKMSAYAMEKLGVVVA